MLLTDLTPGTTKLEAESEIKRKCQRGFDTQLQNIIRDKCENTVYNGRTGA